MTTKMSKQAEALLVALSGVRIVPNGADAEQSEEFQQIMAELRQFTPIFVEEALFEALQTMSEWLCEYGLGLEQYEDGRFAITKVTPQAS